MQRMACRLAAGPAGGPPGGAALPTPEAPAAMPRVSPAESLQVQTASPERKWPSAPGCEGP
jgi:hypothetical protein